MALIQEKLLNKKIKKEKEILKQSEDVHGVLQQLNDGQRILSLQEDVYLVVEKISKRMSKYNNRKDFKSFRTDKNDKINLNHTEILLETQKGDKTDELAQSARDHKVTVTSNNEPINHK
jgi:hypothetical protein